MTRNSLRPLLQYLDKKEFSIITGTRQTGKSTMMKQLGNLLNITELSNTLPYPEQPHSLEIICDQALIKINKYKKFESAYPDIPLSFAWLYPFGEDFFRREIS